MPIRTTIVISEDVYKKLVEMAIEKYGHARAISKVIEDLVREKEKKGNAKKILEKIEELKRKGLLIKLNVDIVKLIKESREEIVMRKLENLEK